VSGAFGRGRDVYGLTTIKALTAGNCTLTNMPISVASDSSFSRPRSNGLLGLRELVKFGAVLDLRNHLLYLRPSRPGDSVGPTSNRFSRGKVTAQCRFYLNIITYSLAAQ
jgi:hypothetical protein